MNTRSQKILRYLKDREEYVTSETLSALNNVSSKTILKDIKSLNEDLKHTDNFIEVVPSMGLKLVVNDIEKLVNFYNSINHSNKFLIQGVVEREEWILNYLLESNEWVKVETLCHKLYVSQSVFSQNLKFVRRALRKYDLTLSQKPHYGIKVDGREFNKRLCLAEIQISRIYQIEEFPGTHYDAEELYSIKKIENIVDRILTQFKISMSEVSVQNFVIQIFISLKRIKSGMFLKSSNDMVLDIAHWRESVVAVEIAKMINEELGVEMRDQEIVSLSIHLAAKRIIRETDESIHKIIEDFDVPALVNNMINNIKKKWQLDFTQDNELYTQLELHLIPLEVRSRYNVVLRNPLIDQIKQQNILSYQMAVTACENFYDYHGNRLSEDEIGYIALHINLALLRKQINNKKNVLIVSGIGRGTAHTLAYKLKDIYGKYINEIKTTDYIGLNNYNFSDINLLISSMPLKNKYPVNTVEVNYFLKEHDIKQIEKYILNQKAFNIKNYLHKNLCIYSKAKNKEDVISYIIRNAIDDNGLSQIIINSDEVVSNELDNLVVMLSLNCVSQSKTRVIICVLSKPILWCEKRIQLVILPIIGEPIDSSTLKLFKELTCLIQDPIFVKRVIRHKSFEEILKIFDEIEVSLEI